MVLATKLDVTCDGTTKFATAYKRSLPSPNAADN